MKRTLYILHTWGSRPWPVLPVLRPSYFLIWYYKIYIKDGWVYANVYKRLSLSFSVNLTISVYNQTITVLLISLQKRIMTRLNEMGKQFIVTFINSPRWFINVTLTNSRNLKSVMPNFTEIGYNKTTLSFTRVTNGMYPMLISMWYWDTPNPITK